ncbi:Alpha-glucosidase 2 [Cardamine amara subsp. amara]|uniref:Alpha-glucosidase 2 n=1 Tax=Cardamine amara subsp. amara TaxID=228776 RepID=A0ABD0ZMY6_CARAN
MEEDYSDIADKLSNFDDLNKMHYDNDLETYLDFGNHTEKVRLVCDYGEIVRVADEEPELRKVPHVGYVSFFPFMSKIIPPESQILEQQLDLISDENIVWSDYGLLSLAKTSSLYMKWNSLHQPTYWRGPIWMNMNYLILSSLNHYSKVNGPYSNKARDIYEKLRSNLISNVVRNYAETGYIWEHYNQTEGTGEGGRDFTGWSSLILLIMSEQYPRL